MLSTTDPSPVVVAVPSVLEGPLEISAIGASGTVCSLALREKLPGAVAEPSPVSEVLTLMSSTPSSRSRLNPVACPDAVTACAAASAGIPATAAQIVHTRIQRILITLSLGKRNLDAVAGTARRVRFARRFFKCDAGFHDPENYESYPGGGAPG
jgi:hypothetical protein